MRWNWGLREKNRLCRAHLLISCLAWSFNTLCAAHNIVRANCVSHIQVNWNTISSWRTNKTRNEFTWLKNWSGTIDKLTTNVCIQSDVSRFKSTRREKEKSRICWLKFDEWMECSERVLSSCWWVNVFRTRRTVSR